MKVVRFTDSELDSVRFAVADKMLQLQQQAVEGQMANEEAANEIATLGKAAEKCNRLFPVRQVA